MSHRLIVFICGALCGSSLWGQALTEFPELEMGCGTNAAEPLVDRPSGRWQPPARQVQTTAAAIAMGHGMLQRGLPSGPVTEAQSSGTLRTRARSSSPAGTTQALHLDTIRQSAPAPGMASSEGLEQVEPMTRWEYRPGEAAGESWHGEEQVSPPQLTTSLPAWYVEERAVQVTTGHPSVSPTPRVGQPAVTRLNSNLSSVWVRGDFRAAPRTLRYLRRGCGG